MNKRFVAEVFKLAPEFSVVEDYFYEKPVGHILCGFICEKRPSATYFWRYAFPLYDRFEFLHLCFASELPLPDGMMTAKRGSEKALAQEFIKRIQPYRSETASLAQLDRFAAYIETEIGLVRNPIIRRGYALTLILLDRVDEAANELTALVSSDTINRGPQSCSDLAPLLNDLSMGTDVAKKTLEEWELETKRCLGLT